MHAGEHVPDGDRTSTPRWSVVVLVLVLLFDVWYRAATFAPVFATEFSPRIWPAATGASEPLDCDEAAYAYIGHRVLQGDVLYRDLTENKPPLGYWLYTLAVKLGGYNELAIRLLPIPFVLATLILLWWVGGMLAGPPADCLAALLYAVLSTDPYLFGNGSNMEHFMNAFSVAALALLLWGQRRDRRLALVAAGGCLACATLVKQVAIVPALVAFVALLYPNRNGASAAGSCPRPWSDRVRDLVAFGLGAAVALAAAAVVLIAQGAGAAAYEDIMRYGRALATDTLPEPGAPSGLVHWLTGNADPSGRLPWPFGNTNYLVWWGTGSWPLWLAAVLCVLYLLFGPGMSHGRRVVAAWTLALACQVVLPGLYWQHYYLLLTPGVALVVAITMADCVASLSHVRTRKAGPRRLLPALVAGILLVVAMGWTAAIQVRAYLLVPPRELTVRYKGGGQWVALRALGKEIARRSFVWPDPHLYVWGWQSPLHFYGELDGVTRHFFVDNLLRDQAERDHWLIRPRIEEIMRALHARPPALIFVGYRPFPALHAFLQEHYVPSRLVPSVNGMGLWVDRAHQAAFDGVPPERTTPGS